MGVVLAAWGMVKNGPNGSHMTVHGDGGYTFFLYVVYGAVRRGALVHL